MFDKAINLGIQFEAIEIQSRILINALYTNHAYATNVVDCQNKDFKLKRSGNANELPNVWRKPMMLIATQMIRKNQLNKNNID